MEGGKTGSEPAYKMAEVARTLRIYSMLQWVHQEMGHGQLKVLRDYIARDLVAAKIRGWGRDCMAQYGLGRSEWYDWAGRR